MLHIILGILKIIAIVLGILLLILLALILSVLFVPVRYHLELAKHPEDEVRAQARVSWLLHSISIHASFRLDQGLDLAIRLFGIRLPFFENDSSRNQQSKERMSNSKKKRKGAVAPSAEKAGTDGKTEKCESIQQDDIGDVSENARSDEETEVSGEVELEESLPDASDSDEIVDRALTSSVESETKKKTVPVDAEVHRSEIENENKKAAEAEESASPQNKQNFFERFAQKIHALQERIRKIRFQFCRFYDRMRKMKKQAVRMCARPEELRKLLEKLEARALLDDVLQYLGYLLRHFRPRRIEGYLRFGTGDPALSAQLTGVLYLLLPVRADRFQIDTEFNEMVFETDLVCSGYIRCCHVVRIIWQGFRNRKIRRLIRYLRKKERV